MEVSMVKKSESGQGFVEYALIFSFVVLVVIVVLALLGQTINEAYAHTIATIKNYSHQTTSVITAAHASFSAPDTVTVTINLSTSSKVDITDSGGAGMIGGVSCPGTCTVTLNGSSGHGIITVSAESGGVTTISYP